MVRAQCQRQHENAGYTDDKGCPGTRLAVTDAMHLRARPGRVAMLLDQFIPGNTARPSIYIVGDSYWQGQ